MSIHSVPSGLATTGILNPHHRTRTLRTTHVQHVVAAKAGFPYQLSTDPQFGVALVAGSPANDPFGLVSDTGRDNGTNDIELLTRPTNQVSVKPRAFHISRWRNRAEGSGSPCGS